MSEELIEQSAEEQSEPISNDTPPSIPEEAATAEDTESEDAEVDYEDIIRQDLDALRAEFPELASITEITQLHNPLRYAALRDMGLTAAEAYKATSPRQKPRDNRAHLTAAMPRAGVNRYGGMTKREMDSARELFEGLSDSEIQALYKSVTC